MDFEDIHCEGITKITPEDIKYAKAMHRAIKLLAVSYTHLDVYKRQMLNPVNSDWG